MPHPPTSPQSPSPTRPCTQAHLCVRSPIHPHIETRIRSQVRGRRGRGWRRVGWFCEYYVCSDLPGAEDWDPGAPSSASAYAPVDARAPADTDVKVGSLELSLEMESAARTRCSLPGQDAKVPAVRTAGGVQGERMAVCGQRLCDMPQGLTTRNMLRLARPSSNHCSPSARDRHTTESHSFSPIACARCAG